MEKETRTIKMEIRALPESRTIEGYAAVYNAVTDLGWFTEQIEPGAFDGSDMSDVVALFNHDPNFPLARTSSGTLSLELDDKGLKYKFEAPNTSYGNDLLESIKRGDISHSSFAFTIEKQRWIEEIERPPLRVIERIGVLFDVSPVTYPAYKDTSVSARSLEEFKALQNKGVCDKDYPQLVADILNLKK